jgi:hypothetical protein
MRLVLAINGDPDPCLFSGIAGQSGKRQCQNLNAMLDLLQ